MKKKGKEVKITWIGQSGFCFETGGVKIVIDPYLSDSANRIFGKKFGRKIPVPVLPEDLEADIALITHDHLDHLDPDTVKRMKSCSKTVYAGPRGVALHLLKLGIKSSKIVRVDSGEKINIKGLDLESVFAMPTDAGTLDTVGFVFGMKNGPKLYVTGDTAYSDFLGHIKAKKPDVMFTVINSFCNNLSIDEAVKAAGLVKPKIVVPMHFGLMNFDSINPFEFEEKMRRMCPKITVRIPELMKPFYVNKEEQKVWIS